MLIEVHSAGLPAMDLVLQNERLFSAFRQCGYRMFHKDRNGWGCLGYRCLEFSLISAGWAKKMHRLAYCPEVSEADFSAAVVALQG